MYGKALAGIAAVVSLMLIVIFSSCANDPASGSPTATKQWAKSDVLTSLASSSNSGSIVTAYFDPGTATLDATTNTYTTTLNYYLKSLNTTANPMTLHISGSSGITKTYAITTTLTPPIWLSQDISFTTTETGSGNQTFNAWIEMDDATTTNKISAPLAFFSSSTTVTGTQIESAHFEPGITCASSAASSCTTTPMLYLSSIASGVQLRSVRMTGSDNSSYEFAVTSTPTVPGWYSISGYTVPNIEGTYTYTFWIINSDGTSSNQVSADLTLTNNLTTATGTTTISSAAFDPDTVNNGKQAYAKLYVNSVANGTSIKSVKVQTGSDIKELTVSAQPEIPGWLSASSNFPTFTAPTTPGTHSYTMWLVMSDDTESNQLTATLTTLNTTAGNVATISDVIISPATQSLTNNGASVTLDDPNLSVYINSIDPSFRVMEGNMSCETLGIVYKYPLYHDELTIPGWESLGTVSGLGAILQSAGAGTYECDISLLLDNGVAGTSASPFESNSIQRTITINP